MVLPGFKNFNHGQKFNTVSFVSNFGLNLYYQNVDYFMQFWQA